MQGLQTGKEEVKLSLFADDRIPHTCCAVLCCAGFMAQLRPTLCNPMDCSPPGSSVHGDSPGKNTGVGCHALLQWIFLTQGSKPGLPHLGRFFTVWATREDPEYWSRYPILSPGDLPNPVIKLGSPAMQGNYLPAELPGKPVIIHKKP